VSRRARFAAVVALAAACAVALAAAGAARGAPAGAAGAVTFLAGEATRIAAAGGKAEPLARGASVYEGDAVETRRRTRLEIRLADGSVMRVGPLSRVVLERAAFGTAPEDRKVSARLVVGAVWAKVARAIGGESRFEVTTANAIAGVRGTTFRVDAARDASVVVKVYSGTVAVGAGPIPLRGHREPAPARHQVAGPSEVTRDEWERIVTGMMQVAVSADGVPGEARAFALARDGADGWETWNRRRDAAR
jgi:hypothetical protein